MGKYGGTILTGRENFSLWQGNLEVELAAMRLKKFLQPENCSPPLFYEKANEAENKAFQLEIEDWEFKHAQALKTILQSVDNTNKIAIQSCRTAASAYETLKSRYGMKDTALLAQMLSQLFAVQNMKHSTVTEKYDLIVNLTAQIAQQQQEATIPDIIQAVILMRSLSTEYDTTVEILTNKDRFPKVYEVFQAAKGTETKLDESLLEVEIADAAQNSKLATKSCWVCKGNHVKPSCPKWLATEEGKLFKKSGLKWHQW